MTTDTGEKIEADYVIVTFSDGVLQGDSITFIPEWKMDAIRNLDMVNYFVIYSQFSLTFWDDRQWVYYAGGPDKVIFLNFNRLYP